MYGTTISDSPCTDNRQYFLLDPPSPKGPEITAPYRHPSSRPIRRRSSSLAASSNDVPVIAQDAQSGLEGFLGGSDRVVDRVPEGVVREGIDGQLSGRGAGGWGDEGFGLGDVALEGELGRREKVDDQYDIVGR